ncbi:hypothetical protein FE69_15475, partial [Staphylococcus aureus]
KVVVAVGLLFRPAHPKKMLRQKHHIQEKILKKEFKEIKKKMKKKKNKKKERGFKIIPLSFTKLPAPEKGPQPLCPLLLLKKKKKKTT